MSTLRSTHCHNCGEPLVGPFCATCGQKDEERILPLKHLLHEVFHDVVHLDARFLGTLGKLVRPGALTLEYLAGRRARWFPPFRLYLIVSLLFFALASTKPPSKEFRIAVKQPAPAIASIPGPNQEPKPKSRLEKRAEEINRDPGAFLAKLMAWLPRALFLLLPVFALLLKIAYLRTRTLFAVHVIFSLHEHAFVFLTLLVVSLLGYIPYVRSVRGFLLFYLPAHLVLGLKRVYQQGMLLTLVKAAVIGFVHMVVAVAVLTLTAVMLMWFS